MTSQRYLRTATVVTLAVFALAACEHRFAHLGQPPPMSPMTTPKDPIDPNAVNPRAPIPQAPPNIGRRGLPRTPGLGRGHSHALGANAQGAIGPDALHTASVNRFSVPGSARASLWSAGPDSLFGDRRAKTIGDIVTVLIEIEDEATIENNTTRSRAGTEDVQVPSFLGLPSIADVVLPGAGTLNPAISTNSTTTTSGDGEISRNEEISLRIAATVIDVLPNGHLVVTGNQEVRVNFELRDLQVAGVIRPEDISRLNTITYDKIANARISYGGRGQITDLQQPRIGQQIVDLVSPF